METHLDTGFHWEVKLYYVVALPVIVLNSGEFRDYMCVDSIIICTSLSR